ncbi:MAG: hypothetical protein ACRCV5_15825 [Afipia sp.]
MGTKLAPIASLAAGFIPTALKVLDLLINKANVSVENRKKLLDASESITTELGSSAKMKMSYDAQRARIHAMLDEEEKKKQGG